MNGNSRQEYLGVIYARYRRADLPEKQVILNEFCRNTGFNRKYAIRLLNGPGPDNRGGPETSARFAELQQRGDRDSGCGLGSGGVSLRGTTEGPAALVDALVRKRFRPSPITQRGVLRISARPMDCRLEERKKRVANVFTGELEPSPARC
jgi:hypothetical protein